MYTSCPACKRQFRILARQLSAAGGTVKCGFCGEQFNALLFLSDTSSADAGLATENELPEVLREPAPARSKKKPSWGWTAGAIFLVLVFVSQLFWFNRDQVLSKWPELRQWVQAACQKLNCVVVREYRTSDIKLISRDVRLHPRYDDTLLVNATMSNSSDTIQPYPDIQFALFDTSGRMIAEREFRPEEYLDNSIAIEDGMPSGQPVHFVLEVTGPTAGAVSFEFRFL